MNKRKWNKTLRPNEISIGFSNQEAKLTSGAGLLTSRFSKTREGFTFTHNTTPKYRLVEMMQFWFRNDFNILSLNQKKSRVKLY